MIGVATLPERQDDHSRTKTPQNFRDLQASFVRVLEVAVGQVQRFAMSDMQDVAGFDRFRLTLCSGSAGPGLSPREVKDAGSPTSRLHHEQGATAGLFHVVAMGRNGEDIHSGRRRRGVDHQLAALVTASI